MNVIRALFSSKKFSAGIVGSLVILAGQFFPAWAQTGDVVQALAMVDWAIVSGPLLVAIGAQGLADFGKEKAKTE